MVGQPWNTSSTQRPQELCKLFYLWGGGEETKPKFLVINFFKNVSFKSSWDKYNQRKIKNKKEKEKVKK